MTRAGNHAERDTSRAEADRAEADRAEGDPAERDADRAEADGVEGNRAESQAELVERLRHNAVQFLAHVSRPPRSLRIRAGDVSVDVEWADGPVAAEAETRVPSGTGGHAPSGNGGTVRTTVATVPSMPDDLDRSLHYLTAPTVGTFYHAPQPGAPPFVVEGDTVAAGQQVGIVEAMKVMIPVEADAAGRVVEVLKGNGEPVEYGERLLALAVEPPAAGEAPS